MQIITLDRVTKRYRLSQIGSRTIREEIARSLRRLALSKEGGPAEDDEFFALRDVSFVVESGETIGLIGPNGAGKSTILKLLARIIYPTGGKIAVRGSVASLIEIGAGFHPELTGRQNIYLYGSIMGMRRAEVRAKFDRIVDFAELRRFIDTPVKRYSSGMYARLGFAVAAHINPDVLLVDEVLAVGDEVFQGKCLRRIEELRRGGTTIVFVSHDMAAVERLCSRVLFLHQGRIVSEGEPREAIADYYDAVVFRSAGPADGDGDSLPRSEPAGRDAEIVDLRFFDRAGKQTDRIATGEPLTARITYRMHRPVEEPVFELFFYSADDRLHCHYSTALTGEQIAALDGSGEVEMVCDELGLAPGLFRVEATIVRRDAVDDYARTSRRYVLHVLPGTRVRGMFHSPHRWRLLPRSGGESRMEAPSSSARARWRTP